MFDVAVENSFDFRSEEYAELFQASDATAFQHPVWLTNVYTSLVPQCSAQPLIVVVRSSSDRRLAMVLPLVRKRYGAMRLIEFADLKVSDYASPVCDAASFNEILRDTSTREQIRKALRPFDVLRIQKIRDGALPLEELLGTTPRASMDMNAYAVPLLEDFQAWRDHNLTASYRKELDKKLRQLHRRGTVRFECSMDPGVIRNTFEAIQGYRRLRFEGREGEELLQIPSYFEFYLGIAMGGRGGFARTYSITVDDHPIAGVLGLSHNGRFLVILGGFDHTRFKNQSIGALMFEQVARDCIERGDSVLDFTIGDEPYKLSFGAEPSSVWMVSRAGSPLGALAGIAIDRVPGAKALAKRLVLRPRRSSGERAAVAQAKDERPGQATAAGFADNAEEQPNAS